MSNTDIAVDPSTQGNGGLLAWKDTAVSRTGRWRVVHRFPNGGTAPNFYVSSDGGNTWSTVGAPTGVTNTGAVAIWDDGTIHFTFDTGTQLNYYKYASGAWSAPVRVQGTTNLGLATIHTDDTNLVVIAESTVGAGPLWRSTNGGTTWVAGSAAPQISYPLNESCWIGNYLWRMSGSGGGAGFIRYDWTLNAWSAGQMVTVGNGYSRICANGSTSDLYIVQPNIPAGTWLFSLWHSTDGGATWANVVSGETLPAGLGSNLNGSVCIGSDGLIHVYGQNGSNFTEVTRSLVATPSYSAVANLTPAVPAGYSSTTGSGGDRAWPERRNDGGNTAAAVYVHLYSGGSGAPDETFILEPGVRASGWCIGAIRIG